MHKKQFYQLAKSSNATNITSHPLVIQPGHKSGTTQCYNLSKSKETNKREEVLNKIYQANDFIKKNEIDDQSHTKFIQLQNHLKISNNNLRVNNSGRNDFLGSSQSQQIQYHEFSFQITEQNNPLCLNLGYQPTPEMKVYEFMKKTAQSIKQLDENKNKLKEECIQIKKQLILFERCKKNLFDDVQNKISKPLIKAITKQRNEYEKIRQTLDYTKNKLQQSKTIQKRLEAEKLALSEDLKSSKTYVEMLKAQVREAKEELNRLKSQNQEFSNQVNLLQTITSKNDGPVERLDKLKDEIKQSKVHLRLNTSQDFTCQQFKQMFLTHQMIGKGFQSVHKELLCQNCLNSIQLNCTKEMASDAQNRMKPSSQGQFQRQIFLYKFFSLMEVMNEIKHQIFGLMDEKIQFHQNESNLLEISKKMVEELNKTLQKINQIQSKQSFSKRPNCYKEERGVKRNMSNQCLKNLTDTMRTSESQPYTNLAKSYSESKLLIQNFNELQENKKQDPMDKLQKITRRLQKLRMKVSINIRSIL